MNPSGSIGNNVSEARGPPSGSVSASASGSGASPPWDGQRRERSAIAAQACETCRSRKSRCDEKRPRCSLCARLGVECRYREPVATKKDRSISFMMQQLSRMESKLDAIGSSVSPNNDIFHTPAGSPSKGSESVRDNQLVDDPYTSPNALSCSSSQPEPNRLPAEKSTAFQQLTTPHKILLWPAIIERMQQSGLVTAKTTQMLVNEGTAWFLRLEHQRYPDPLPCDPFLQSRQVGTKRVLDGHPRVTFAELTRDRMLRLADSYFDSYNVLYPLIDRDEFEENVLPDVMKQGFAYGDVHSVVALLVFSLGQVAHGGVWERPIQVVEGRPSGIRGGSADRPPGLDIFNEARRRIGFVMSLTSVENIQILQLTAVYYEATCRHLDFWRSSVSASMAFQVLIKCEPALDWDSSRGHQLRMVYWTCNLIENWYHMDLDLPRTGIEDYEDLVPLPGKETKDIQQEQIKMQFLAMITLRRVISRIHVTIFEAANTAESHHDYAGPPMHVIKELTRQLDKWRTLLPPVLQWNDQDRSTTTVDSPVELGNSHLRSRYYYACFMIYRPFVYKALHFPAQLSEEDSYYTAQCLQASLFWPVSMDPPRMRKRLIPYLFAWTQNFLGVLLILRMTTANPTLKAIAQRHLDTADVERTVELLLDWFRDMRQVDGMAAWAWNILSQIYEDTV